MNYLNLLLDTGLQSDFITTFFPILRIILVSLIFVAAIVLIIVVLLQSDVSGSGTTNVISGARESYYSQNKGDTRDGRLKKLTVAMSVIIAVSIIIYFITLMINRTI